MRFTSVYWAVSLAMIVAAVSAGSALSSTQAARPTIVFFTPDTASKGASFLISGNNLKGATSVKLGGVSVKFTVVSTHAITASVPTTAKSGKLTVTTKSGTGTSKTAFKVIPRRFA